MNHPCPFCSPSQPILLQLIRRHLLLTAHSIPIPLLLIQLLTTPLRFTFKELILSNLDSVTQQSGKPCFPYLSLSLVHSSLSSKSVLSLRRGHFLNVIIFPSSPRERNSYQSRSPLGPIDSRALALGLRISLVVRASKPSSK